MNQDEFNERLRTLAWQEISAKQWGWFYFSWADESGWLGAAYMQGYGPTTARLRCGAMGINPGGECMIIKVPPEVELPPADYRNRLLNREELMTIDPEAKTLAEWKKEDSITPNPRNKDRYPD